MIFKLSANFKQIQKNRCTSIFACISCFPHGGQNISPQGHTDTMHTHCDYALCNLCIQSHFRNTLINYYLILKQIIFKPQRRTQVHELSKLARA